jgi:ATPase subunit of ABC transporter with duplicated ATPase domains
MEPASGVSSSSHSNLTEAVIEATSQVSRFHLETVEATSNKSLQLQQVNLAIGSSAGQQRQLLSDAVLQLQAGVRYGLIGRWAAQKAIQLREQ